VERYNERRAPGYAAASSVDCFKSLAYCERASTFVIVQLMVSTSRIPTKTAFTMELLFGMSAIMMKKMMRWRESE